MRQEREPLRAVTIERLRHTVNASIVATTPIDANLLGQMRQRHTLFIVHEMLPITPLGREQRIPRFPRAVRRLRGHPCESHELPELRIRQEWRDLNEWAKALMGIEQRQVGLVVTGIQVLRFELIRCECGDIEVHGVCRVPYILAP